MIQQNKKNLERHIVGEGAYGCVFKPSLPCAKKPKSNLNYNDYVSKFMKTKNAEIELKEFLFIGKMDPDNEFHLGLPIICELDFDDTELINDIKKCSHIKDDLNSTQFKKDYSLLLIKYGGPDLKALCNNYLIKYLFNDKEYKTDHFWLEVHHLIKGLKFFKDNGIVHNDIKPQNILFNLETGKMKYIDFGLMRKKKEIIRLSEKSDNRLGVFHWSYPFDCGFMNKSYFKEYKNFTINPLYRKDYEQQFSKLIVTDSKINSFSIPIKNPKAFKILFSYLNLNNQVPDSTTQYSYISSFFDGFNQLIFEEKKTYDKFLNDTIDSIDVFGLGFTLQFMANCFKRHKAISLQDYTRLSAFFHKMYDFNPINRTIDIDLLLNEYENILLEIGVLTRLNKNFKNNNLYQGISEPLKENITEKPLSTILDKFANKDPIKNTIKIYKNSVEKCRLINKDFNPFTKRCLKKCPEGFERNNKYTRCIKRKNNIKSIKSKSIKSKSIKSKSIKSKSIRSKSVKSKSIKSKS
jgi:serine/threonine protein kinase